MHSTRSELMPRQCRTETETNHKLHRRSDSWRDMQNVLERTEILPVPFLDLKLQYGQLQDGLESVIRPLLASANYMRVLL